MTLVLIVWLVTTFIPSLGVVTAIALVLGACIFAFCVLFALIEEETSPFLKFISYKKSIIAIIFLACALPSKESTWYMIGAYGTQKLVENPVAKELASDGVDVLKALMAKAKKELTEDGSKKAEK